jgi:hypothetical protein
MLNVLNKKEVMDSHMKKGIQYSHYCGTELVDLSAYIRLAEKLMKDKELERESIAMLKHASERLDALTRRIARLDKINEMDY